MIFPVDVVKEWRNNYFVTSGKHCFWRQDVSFYCVTNDHKFGDLKQHSLSHHAMRQKSRHPSTEFSSQGPTRLQPRCLLGWGII